MANIERVTVTLPENLTRAIDSHEKNRSKFVAEAVRRELDRRRRAERQRSLQSPHPQSAELAGQALEEWSCALPTEAAQARVHTAAGKAVP